MRTSTQHQCASEHLRYMFSYSKILDWTHTHRVFKIEKGNHLPRIIKAIWWTKIVYISSSAFDPGLFSCLYFALFLITTGTGNKFEKKNVNGISNIGQL